MPRTRLTVFYTAMFLVACGDNLGPPVAPPDASVVPDAEPPPACCRFLPDQDAVRACVDLPAGTCGVIACPDPDGGTIKINACGPPL